MLKKHKKAICVIVLFFMTINLISLFDIGVNINMQKVYASGIAYNGQNEIGTYTINTPEQLNLLSNKVNSGITYENTTFIITSDIVFNNDKKGNFTRIGTKDKAFMGNLDGQNYTISGLVINNINAAGDEENYIGFIGHLKNGTIKNLGIEIFDNSLLPGGYTGILTGTNDKGTIDNCYSFKNANEIKINKVVSLVYRNYGVMKNCYNSGNITITAYSVSYGGVLCTYNYGKIINSYNSGKIQIFAERIAQIYAGIAHYNYGEITECYNIGEIEGQFGSTGIVSNNNGLIEKCYNEASIRSNEFNGSGLVAYNNSGGIIKDCYNIGNILGGAGAGGISNTNYGTIKGCYNTGEIRGVFSIETSNPHKWGTGGIVGEARGGTIQYCYNKGKVSTSLGQAGGIIGTGDNLSENIISCYNAGEILNTKDNVYTGGLIGWSGKEQLLTESEVGSRTIIIGERPDGDPITKKISIYKGDKEFSNIVNSFYLTGGNNCKNSSYYIGRIDSTSIPPTVFGDSNILGLNASQMQEQSFVDTLNSSGENMYVKDSSYINGGYPIFKWQQSVTNIVVIGDTNIEETKFNSFSLNVTPADVDTTYSWTVENKNIISVVSVGNGKSAVILGISKGVSKVTVTANDKNKCSVTFTVRVIASAIQGKDGYYLVGEEIEYLSRYYDDENDPKHHDEYKYTHTATRLETGIILDNSMGQISFNNTWLADSVKSFGKPGAYEVSYRVQDNPPTANKQGFTNYRYYSSPAVTTIYIHRKPIANYTITSNRVTDNSYDLDHSVSMSNKGIIKWEWTYINDEGKVLTHTDANKASGVNIVNSWLVSNLNSEYELLLRVQDAELVWSNFYNMSIQIPDIDNKPDNKPPIADFNLISNENPLWIIPRTFNLQTILYRPLNTFFHEEKVKFANNIYDLDINNTGFKYSWKLERFAVKDISKISGLASNTYSYTTETPFTNSYKNMGLQWGAYRITLSVADKPPIPPYKAEDEKTATVTKIYYIVPEITLNGSIEPNSSQIVAGETVKLKAKTNKYATSAEALILGSTVSLTRVSEDINYIYWEKIYTVPENAGVGGSYINFAAYTNYGGNGSSTRKVEDKLSINIFTTNRLPIADFDLISNENPAWIFPKITNIQTLLNRPMDGFFHEEQVKFVNNAYDVDTNNTGFKYNWKLERFAVKDVNNISGSAANTYSYTTETPFANSYKNMGLQWGAYRITLSVTDKPPIPPYKLGDEKSSTVTKTYYIIPELTLTGSFKTDKPETMTGDTIKLKAKTNKYVTSSEVSVLDSTLSLSKVSEDANYIYWETNYTVPESTEGGRCYISFFAYTNYGGSGSNTRKIEDRVPIDITALKLINFRIIDIVNHFDVTFPYTKDMLINDLIDYKTGYYVTFLIDSKGKPDSVKSKILIDGILDQNIILEKISSGTTDTWRGKFYTDTRLPEEKIVSIITSCNKGAVTYDYNLKENWDGRSLIIKGSALQDGRINLTN